MQPTCCFIRINSWWTFHLAVPSINGAEGSHPLENKGVVSGMVKQRHALFTGSPIKLIFNINSSLDIWASWRRINSPIWWQSRAQMHPRLDCYQTPENVSCASCCIIEMKNLSCYSRLRHDHTGFKWHCYAHSCVSEHANSNNCCIALHGVWIPAVIEQCHYPRRILSETSVRHTWEEIFS